MLVRVRWLLIVLTACGGAKATQPPVVTAPAKPVEEIVTELDVQIVDAYGGRASCADVPPRRFDVLLDGVVVDAVLVPCFIGVRAPPPRFHAKPFAVRPGVHTIGVVDVSLQRTRERAIQFPVVEDSFLADKLIVWVDDEGIEINEPVAISIAL